ncbi:hypothetical protein N480_09730 [Pseudoalteromonas luteoviolacea S2607]|nr:hypothetical protein N480_09730 [Pseudoalteromonas luteoviolacea S2607]
MIDFITRYNNYYPLEDMPLTKEMRIDGVDPIPMSKWNWGLVNRPGYLKSVSEEELYLSLLEVGEVTVHRGYLLLPGRFLKRRDGNNSKGLKYKCEWTKENGIQDLNEGPNKLPRLSCRFMRYSMGQIFIETEDGFKKAVLTEVDAAYQTMSDEEVRNDKIHQSNKLKNLKSKHDEKQGETRLKASNIVAKAASEKAPISTHEANSQDITANREESHS